MWAAFKLLPNKLKIAWLGTILVTLAALLAATAFVSYNKGFNESRFAIIQYEKEKTELKSKLDAATSKVDIKYITKYVKDVEYIDRVQTKTVEVIKTVVPEQYKLSQGWINTYNASVVGAEPQDAGNSNPSAFSDRYALERIAKNNAQCLANANQLEALQSLITEREAEIAKITGNK
jgi:hypothetical protein